MMSEDPTSRFHEECQINIHAAGQDRDLLRQSLQWNIDSAKYKYTYNFSVLGRPIIQFPQDMVQLQELIWQVNPDLIIETGIAHGGSLIQSASLLAMLDYCEAVENQRLLDPKASKRRVLGVDIDIRDHNRSAIETHPMSHLIHMIQGSSISEVVVSQVVKFAANYRRVLVILDSNHTHDHVLAELMAYAPLTSRDSYCVVFDTIVEDLPDAMFPDRPWGKGNNPKTAVWEYLSRLESGAIRAADGECLQFRIDKQIEHKLLVTVAPDGYLQRI
jgi:cephalosporin hydroxylase